MGRGGQVQPGGSGTAGGVRSSRRGGGFRSSWQGGGQVQPGGSIPASGGG